MQVCSHIATVLFKCKWIVSTFEKQILGIATYAHQRSILYSSRKYQQCNQLCRNVFICSLYHLSLSVVHIHKCETPTESQMATFLQKHKPKPAILSLIPAHAYSSCVYHICEIIGKLNIWVIAQKHILNWSYECSLWKRNPCL